MRIHIILSNESLECKNLLGKKTRNLILVFEYACNNPLHLVICNSEIQKLASLVFRIKDVSVLLPCLFCAERQY